MPTYTNERDAALARQAQFIKLVKRAGYYTALATIALVVLFGSWDIVPPGHRGILIRAGHVQDTVLGEGFTFKRPITDTVKAFPIRIEESTIQSDAATTDTQKVFSTLSLNWHVTPDKVNDVYRNIGEPSVIQATVITHAVSEVLKAQTAKMTAEEILARRMELKNSIDADLIGRMKQFGITVDAVNLSDFHFDNKYSDAVEEKQVAEQNAKKAIYDADKAKNEAAGVVNAARGRADSKVVEAKADAEATLVQARADAEANALKQKTLTDQLIRYETVQKWNGAPPSVMLGNGGSGAGFLMNITAGAATTTSGEQDTE